MFSIFFNMLGLSSEILRDLRERTHGEPGLALKDRLSTTIAGIWQKVGPLCLGRIGSVSDVAPFRLGQPIVNAEA
jgi:hypothetical protein